MNKSFSETLQLDLHSGLPIYIQIIDQIKQQIANRSLKPGDQLPTVRALAQELRINFNTVARAYRLLDEAGIISTQQGRGTYIMEEAAARGGRTTAARVAPGTGPPLCPRSPPAGLFARRNPFRVCKPPLEQTRHLKTMKENEMRTKFLKDLRKLPS